MRLSENDIYRLEALSLDNLGRVEGSGCGNCFLYLALEESWGGRQILTSYPYDEYEKTDNGDE